MMKYYATVKHHSTVGFWEKLNASTLRGAKCQATKEFGSGYISHVIHLVELDDGEDTGRVNDYQAHTKIIGQDKWHYVG